MTEIDQLVLEFNQATAIVKALRKRALAVWNRASRGQPPLTRDERQAINKASRVLRDATR